MRVTSSGLVASVPCRRYSQTHSAAHWPLGCPVLSDSISAFGLCPLSCGHLTAHLCPNVSPCLICPRRLAWPHMQRCLGWSSLTWMEELGAQHPRVPWSSWRCSPSRMLWGGMAGHSQCEGVLHPLSFTAVIALFCRQYDIIKDNDSNNNKEKTKPSSEHSTPERPSGGLLRSKVSGEGCPVGWCMTSAVACCLDRMSLSRNKITPAHTHLKPGCLGCSEP